MARFKRQYNERTGEQLTKRDGSVGSDDERQSFVERVKPLELNLAPRRRKLEGLTSELIDIYCRVMNDTTQELAANAIGYSVRTINDWIAKGQDPACDNDILLELAAKHAYVQTHGNRKTYMDLWREHAVDDPKAAMELAKATIASLNTAKVIKADVTVSAVKPPDMSEFNDMSPEEIMLASAMERAKLKRLNGGK